MDVAEAQAGASPGLRGVADATLMGRGSACSREGPFRDRHTKDRDGNRHRQSKPTHSVLALLLVQQCVHSARLVFRATKPHHTRRLGNVISTSKRIVSWRCPEALGFGHAAVFPMFGKTFLPNTDRPRRSRTSLSELS